MKALKHPGNLIIIGFVVMALGLLSLVYAATQVKFEMAVEGDYYQQEVNYNEQLAAENTARTLGESFSFSTEGKKLKLNIPGNLSGDMEHGKVSFFCLAGAEFDTEQVLHKNADGVYLFDRATVAPGHNYIVKVAFRSHGRDHYKEFSMQ